jgi:hypothetical protein
MEKHSDMAGRLAFILIPGERCLLSLYLLSIVPSLLLYLCVCVCVCLVLMCLCPRVLPDIVVGPSGNWQRSSRLS